ncbi:hypothetical protein PN497_12000 [Sphaerospermopsis kisseleviana CS-549]|uniref:Uncharacterized protein n=1 Tax=Sphaerospermopsis kisseleviana CS-549 TaxID=3021783 RepID=A0ABT4ZRR3_9CYAN|nr:hypothetical protein [Sphaerospermopsis kisseleviana]MDB9442077.1 hypothetical protein [Sphaerospermopsis kisseleviana CS-549]
MSYTNQGIMHQDGTIFYLSLFQAQNYIWGGKYLLRSQEFRRWGVQEMGMWGEKDFSQSPVTSHQSPVTSHQSPVTSHQSPTH